MMEVRVLKEDKKGIEFELIGEGHTFCNALREALNRQKGVEYATYKIEHPLLSNPRIYVRTKVKVSKEMEEETPISKIKGVGPKISKQLERAGVKTAEELVNADLATIARRSKVSPKILEKIFKEAKKVVPPDRFGHKKIIKKALRELSSTFIDIKAKFEEALANA
ncbi:MAG: RpoL/Rpb11 RNA polymerase subunit family protein [Candidatus Hydrothermarchaeales archaeon]